LEPAEAAAFSTGGAALVTSHSTGGVQQWDPVAGERSGPLFELPHPVALLGYSPDGQILAIACRDQFVRLWDAGSCTPLGPPLLHQADVLDMRFARDGASLATLTATGRLHTLPLPKPVADDPERMELWLQAAGGVGLENNVIALLDAEAWRRRRERLQERWPEADPALPRPSDEAAWHDARARDAEEDGNTFAALWHLDRLIALGPQDWLPPARKGLLYAKAGDLGLAESAYRRAAQHAPAEALRGWHRQNAATCLVQGQWSAALRHLDWLVATGGEDWQVQADRATAFGHLEQQLECEAARGRAVQLGADAAFLVPLAEEKAAQGQWPEAAALFARAAERGGLDVLDECNHALTCLKAGDEAGYRLPSGRCWQHLEPLSGVPSPRGRRHRLATAVECGGGNPCGADAGVGTGPGGPTREPAPGLARGARRGAVSPRPVSGSHPFPPASSWPGWEGGKRRLGLPRVRLPEVEPESRSAPVDGQAACPPGRCHILLGSARGRVVEPVD
jgi:Flp pilus assembly protein TadD